MNHFDLVVDKIRILESGYDLKANSSYAMLRHIIQLMGEEKFNKKFKHHFIDNKLNTLSFEASFYDFHKAMRQTDFYDIGEGSGHMDMILRNYIDLN